MYSNKKEYPKPCRIICTPFSGREFDSPHLHKTKSQNPFQTESNLMRTRRVRCIAYRQGTPRLRWKRLGAREDARGKPKNFLAFFARLLPRPLRRKAKREERKFLVCVAARKYSAEPTNKLAKPQQFTLRLQNTEQSHIKKRKTFLTNTTTYASGCMMVSVRTSFTKRERIGEFIDTLKLVPALSKAHLPQ